MCGRKKAPEDLDPLQKHVDVGLLMVLRDVITRWNSTQAMLRHSLIHQDVSVGNFILYCIANNLSGDQEMGSEA